MPARGRLRPLAQDLSLLVPVAIVACLVLGALPAQAKTPDWTKAQPEVLVDGLAMPSDIHVAPDGKVWFTELAGNVSRYDPETDSAQVMHTVPNVVTGGERGLVGMALAQDFAQTGTYFLYYTERSDDAQGGVNRLVRVRDGEQTVLASIPGAVEHNGGRIAIAADGSLFVGTGENQLRDPAQDPDSLLGKILHLTPDGQPAAGNVNGLVYSIGHRNVYGLAVHPETGEVWETENSGWRRDEVNIVKAGGNYGYPECEGQGLNGVDTPCPTTKGYTFPVRTFYEDRTAAPTGATFWRGEFYWASLNEGSIHHLWQDAAGAWQDAIVFTMDSGMPILDLHPGPDDKLYFSTADAILRIALPAEDVGPLQGDPTETGGTAAGPQPTPAPPAAKGTGLTAYVALLSVTAATLLARRRSA